jgi:hypothetical protein
MTTRAYVRFFASALASGENLRVYKCLLLSLKNNNKGFPQINLEVMRTSEDKPNLWKEDLADLVHELRMLL